MTPGWRDGKACRTCSAWVKSDTALSVTNGLCTCCVVWIQDREDPSSSPVLDNNAHSTRHMRSADLTRSPPRSQAVRLQDIPDALLDHIDDDLAAESGSEQIALPEEYRSLVEGAADACSAGSGGGKIASHSAIKPYLRHHGPRQPLATLGNARYK